MKFKDILKVVTIGVLSGTGCAEEGELITKAREAIETKEVDPKPLSPSEIGQMDRDSWDKRVIWNQLSEVDKLEDTVHLVLLPGRHRSAKGTYREIIIATPEQGRLQHGRFATFSLFHQDTPEGVQLSMMRDEGTYRVRAFPSYLPNGALESFTDNQGDVFPLYEPVVIQTTQTDFPKRVEGVKLLTRQVLGKEVELYDPLVHDVAALSEYQERLTIELDECDCLVSVVYEGSLSYGKEWARIVAERTSTLDALGRPVYRATSFNIVEPPSKFIEQGI